jgi:hypothetical protein
MYDSIHIPAPKSQSRLCYPIRGYYYRPIISSDSPHSHRSHGDYLPSMPFAANVLIHEHGNDAEEHATKNLWAARQAQDQAEAARWQSLIDALKECLLHNTARKRKTRKSA